ncbi:hypothetical protein Rhe02_33280 [Rhizocola hellebori]|uniref:RNA polymerase subunit sigma-70 n=1 Tax=Rhizocola hellebori TaxID=1392758 RepID=A0A8J3VGR0_9ACTN|nr:hypothetical protein Rhe02_33280 [Rhizocola hellebori]
MQQLPATQRAALLLRDVLTFSPAETAAQLDTTVAAANSLLQRARAGMAAPHRPSRALEPVEQQILQRFITAWHARDIPALAALLREDAILRMPPERAEFAGRQAIADFFATVPADGRLDLIELVAIHANGQPAVAAYLPDNRGACNGYGIMVFDITGTTNDAAIAMITGFPQAGLFPAFDIPTSRPAT